MNVVDRYIDFAKNEVIEDPEKGWDYLRLGFKANKLKMKLLPKKDLPKAYQKLEHLMMGLIADNLGKESGYVWGNIFAPCEIMQCFGLKTISVECLSCFLAGYHLEDYFIDCAQEHGIAPTLCSYHKVFLGAAQCGAVRYPRYAVTTSMTCDGNLNTFRYLNKEVGVPYTLLDVPYEDDDAAVAYLADQLRALADTLAKEFDTPFDESKLREAIRRENETRALLLEFFDLFATHAYPTEMITQLYLMMGVHLMMGTQEFLDVVHGMNEEIRTYPEFTGKKLLWIHLLPFYQETLNGYFNASGKYEILAGDIILDYMEEMDETHPFEALAKKMLHNVFNGTYDRKAEAVAELVRRTHADGVIHFCHWGCKQASGGSILLKEKMQEMGVPMLILDGDGVDRRNSHDGQIRTRLEAFLELLSAGDPEGSGQTAK